MSKYVMLFLFLIINTESYAAKVVAQLHILNVGAGNCIFFQKFDDTGAVTDKVLFDCGSSRQQMNSEEVYSYFEELIQDQDTTVFISHPDADHYNHLATIFEGIQAKKVYFGGCLQNMNLCGFNIVQPIGTFLQNNDVTYNLPAGGSSVIVKTNDLNINILTANTGYPTNSRNAKNQYSIVNEVSFIFGDQTARIFLPGDGSGETMTMAQNNMVNMDGAKPLATDWVYAISQHHGAATHGSNDVSWYNFIGANSITHSAYGKYSHPRCEVVEALESLELINTPRFPANPHQFKCGQGASMPMKTAQIAKAHHFSTAENGAIIYDWYDDGTVSWTFDTGY